MHTQTHERNEVDMGGVADVEIERLPTSVLCGFYGSLRSGFYNHDRFGLDRYPRLPDTTIKGSMFMVANVYPKLYDVGKFPEDMDRDHTLEVYDIPYNVYRSIYGMEIGAGYEEKEVEVDGNKVKVFLYAGDPRNQDIDMYTQSYS